MSRATRPSTPRPGRSLVVAAVIVLAGAPALGQTSAESPPPPAADGPLQTCLAREATRALRRRLPPPAFERLLAGRCLAAKAAALASHRDGFRRGGMTDGQADQYAEFAVAVMEKNRAFQYRRAWERRIRR